MKASGEPLRGFELNAGIPVRWQDKMHVVYLWNSRVHECAGVISVYVCFRVCTCA